MKPKLIGIELYVPLDNGDTDCCQYDRVPSGVPDNRVWSVVDCDGKLYVVAGYHVVNWLYYVVTMKPWRKGDECYPWE